MNVSNVFSLLPLICVSPRPEDLRVPFEQFGRVRDVYLPRDYYTGYVNTGHEGDSDIHG
jgi:hypothetical protein